MDTGSVWRGRGGQGRGVLPHHHNVLMLSTAPWAQPAPWARDVTQPSRRGSPCPMLGTDLIGRVLP